MRKYIKFLIWHGREGAVLLSGDYALSFFLIFFLASMVNICQYPRNPKPGRHVALVYSRAVLNAQIHKIFNLSWARRRRAIGWRRCAAIFFNFLASMSSLQFPETPKPGSHATLVYSQVKAPILPGRIVQCANT